MEDFIFDNLGKLIFAVVVGLLAFALWVDNASCHAKWESSGHATKWGLMSGCQVRRDDGTWIPSDAVRETDI